MKRVLFIHGSSDLYGASRVLVSIIEGLDRQKIEPIILLPYEEKLDKELEALGTKVIIAPLAVLRRQLFNPKGICVFIVNLFRSLALIRKVDEQYRLDAVYTNTSPVLSGAIYAKVFGKTHIWHIHEIITKPFLFRLAMPRMLRLFSDVCIANSNATKRYVLSGGMEDLKVRVIYNGIPELKAQTAEKVSGEDKNRIVVGMVGRLNWLKGQEVFVKAAARAIRGFDNISFTIAGTCFKNEEIYLRNLKKLISTLGLDDKIRLLDFVEDRPALYAAFDIVVVPTTQPESFGLVAAEAMSMRKPVIASNIGGLPEVVIDGKTGMLFQPGDDNGLSEAILKLAKDRNLRNEMGEAGFAYQQAHFTEDRFQKEIDNLFDDVLK